MHRRATHITVMMGVWLLMFISIVGFELIEQYVKNQNQKWRGAQLIVQTPDEWNESLLGRIPDSLVSTFSVYTNTAIEHGGQWQGIDIQALADGYPLSGAFEVSTGQLISRWEESDVYLSGSLPGLKVNDQIIIGNKAFTLRGYVKVQDEMASFRFLVNPKILMTVSALKASGLWQPGSRIALRYYFSSSDVQALSDFTKGLKGLNNPHLKISTPNDESSWSQFGFEKIKRWHQSIVGVVVILTFLSLWALSHLILQGMERAQSMMSYFGITKQQVHRMWVSPQMMLSLVVWGGFTVCGVLVAFWFDQSVTPWVRLYAFLVAVYGLLLFWDYLETRFWRVTRFLFMGFFMGAYISPDEWFLTLISVFCVLLGITALGYFIDVVRRCIVMWVPLNRPARLLAKHLLRVHHRFFVSMAWMMSLILGVFLGMNVSLVDLEQSLVKQVPVGAPNVFLINMTQSDLAPLGQLLPSGTPFYPVVRARVTEVNGVNVFERKPVLKEDPSFNRELNMTYMTHLPDNNQVIGGEWSSDEKGFSLENDFAKRAGIQLGDLLTVSVYGQKIHGKVLTLRKVAWQSMSPNFFVIAGGGLLSDQVATWMSSFYWNEATSGSLKSLLQEFGHLTVIQVDQIILQVRSWLHRLVTMANGYAALVFLMTLFVSGVLFQRSLNLIFNEVQKLSSLMVPFQQVKEALSMIYCVTQVSGWLVINGGFYVLYRQLFPAEWLSYGHLFLWSALLFFMVLWAGYRYIIKTMTAIYDQS